MASLDFAIVVRLLDKITAPLKAATGSTNALRKSVLDTQKSLSDLNKTQAALNGLQKLQANLEHTKARVAEAATKLDSLKTKLNAVENPTEKLTQQFNKAATALAKLEDKQQKQLTKLGALQSKLAASSLSSATAGNAQERLAHDIAQATKALDAQKNVLDQVTAKQKRLAESQKAVTAARRQMQDKLQMQQDIAGVAYPMLAVGSAGMYAATRPIVSSATHTDSITDIAITGNMTKQAQAQLSNSLRAAALQTNQLQSDLNKGVQILVASGMSAKDAADYAQVLGDTATASRAQMDDIANLTFSLQNNLKIKGKGAMEEAMNNLVHAGKQGRFELNEMARYFPSLGAQMASMGATGQDAVKEIGIAMQAARKASGTSQEAATNMANWFSHMTASSTIDHFEQVGIDLKKEVMGRMQAKDPTKRMSAFRASIDVFDQYVDKLTAGKTITVQTASGKIKDKLNFRDALKQATKDGNESEVRRIVERFGLSKVIQDMQTANFYLAMRQNKDFIDEGMKSFNGADVQKTIATDKARRLESPVEQWKQLQIQANDLSISIGESLMPTLQALMSVIQPIITDVNAWVKANPELTQTLLKIALVSSAVIAGVGGLAVLIISLLGPFAMLRYALVLVGANLGVLGGAFSALTGIFPAITKGLLMLGQAALLNPLVLIAVAIAGAAILIYQNWDKLVSWWNQSSLKPKVLQVTTSALSYAQAKWDQLKNWWNTTTLAQKALGIATAPLQVARVLATDFFNWWLTTELGQKSLRIATDTLDWARQKAEAFRAWWESFTLKSVTASITTSVVRSVASPSSISESKSVFGLGKAIGAKLFGGKVDGARASGGSVRAGGIYRVNELGPELLRMQGQTYLMADQNANVIPLRNMVERTNQRLFGDRSQNTPAPVLAFKSAQSPQRVETNGVLHIKIDSKEPVRIHRMQATGMQLNVHTGAIGGVS